MMSTQTADPGVAAGGDADFQLLGEQVMAAMARFQVPGVAIGLLQGETERTAGFGVTNVEHPLLVDADTLFQIGSTTKTVTATAAMRLVEQGKLDLDAPLRTYLPGLQLADPDVAARVTLRHLFTHTGGWVGDYFDDMGPGDDALAKIVAKLATLPQLTPLGEIWSYNNAGFYLAGRVLEVVTGRPYDAVVQELVLDPLGMPMSFFFAADVITHRVAIGHNNPHEAGGTPPRVARPWALARSAHPAGGLTSTVRDQLRYARFHLGDGTAPDGARLLTPGSLALMQTPRVPAANDEFLGITWFLRDLAGTRIVRHGGATNGQTSAFVIVPAHRFALTVLTNADRGRELHHAITTWALEHYLGLADPDPSPLALPADRLAPYTGLYTAAAGDLDVTLGAAGLVLQVIPKGGFPTADSPPEPAPPPVHAALYADDRLILLEEPLEGTRGEFLRDAAGGIVWLRVGGRVHRRER